MTVIEIPDQQAAALKARAAARILELQKRVKPDPEGWTVHDYMNRERS